MRWTSSFAVMSLAAVVFVPSDAPADVTLELRPATQFVVAGQQTGVEIYAVADPGEPVGLNQVVLSWEGSPRKLAGGDVAGAQPGAPARS